MSADDRWADRREWETERGEIEIKRRVKFPKDLCLCGHAGEFHNNAANCTGPACACKELREAALDCAFQHCDHDAVGTVIVGRVQDTGGQDFEVCEEHWDDAAELYVRGA